MASLGSWGYPPVTWKNLKPVAPACGQLRNFVQPGGGHEMAPVDYAQLGRPPPASPQTVPRSRWEAPRWACPRRWCTLPPPPPGMRSGSPLSARIRANGCGREGRSARAGPTFPGRLSPGPPGPGWQDPTMRRPVRLRSSGRPSFPRQESESSLPGPAWLCCSFCLFVLSLARRLEEGGSLQWAPSPKRVPDQTWRRLPVRRLVCQYAGVRARAPAARRVCGVEAPFHGGTSKSGRNGGARSGRRGRF